MADQHQRVAVVVVHGVADQAPHESVRHVANLLANIDDGGAPAYSAFVEQPLKIPVRAAPRVPPPSPPGGRVGAFLRRQMPAVMRADPAPRSFYELCEAPPTGDDAGLLFTRAVLNTYEAEGPSATFDTVRLRATRRGRDSSAPADVDLFEMYWADLSRVGTSWWRILGELYQVLLHLPSLGKHAASASVANTNTYSGQMFQKATALGSWILSAPILVFNVFFLASAVLVLASLIPEAYHRVIATAVIVTVAAGVMVWLWLTFAHKHVWYRMLASGLVVGALAAALLFGSANPPKLLGLEALGVGLLLIAAPLLKAYDAHRPGITTISVAAALIAVFAAVVAFSRPIDGQAWFQFTAAVGFRIAEIVAVILFFWWTCFFFLGLYPSIVAGTCYAAFGAPDGAGRAVRTAVVSLAMPAAALLILTVSLWAGLFWTLDRNTSPTAAFDQTYRVWPVVASIPRAGERLAEADTGREFIELILEFSLGSGFFGSAALMAAGCLLVVVPLVPIVFAEVRPPRTNRRCRNDGRWLSDIFRVLRVAGPLMVAGVVLMPFSGRLLQALFSVGVLPFGADALSTEAVVQLLGSAVAGTAAGLIGFRGRMKALAGGFRAPLDVLLDVDGYLREHPRKGAPRAKIFARYYSLLEHITSSGSYDRIVVVAHSQGTVITADLFRYLQAFFPSTTAGRVVRFFTMGSPLRQLYARRFPELYDWVWRGSPPLPPGAFPGAPDILPDAKPDPASLGVAVWVNAYRSGDYVGRWLWRPDDCEYLFSVESSGRWQSFDRPLPGQSHDPALTRREFCIGAGAHTHYWDHTAPEIAVELDYLIRT